MNSKIAYIDFLRGSCVLYIVGFWHLFNYTMAFPAYYNEITVRLTVVILGLFVFLSGFLLGKKDIQLNKYSLKDFYIKRVLRIYPLYFVTLCVFVITKISDPLTAVKAGLLISMFYGPPPFTLWFITMLLVFYCFAPVLIYNASHPVKLLTVTTIVFLLFLIICLLSQVSDPRILLYFPAFALGIFWAKRNLLVSRTLLATVVTMVIISLAISVFFKNIPETSLLSIPLACLCPLGIVLICDRNKDLFKPSKLFFLLSYLGYAMYLIHRPVFVVMKYHLFFPANEIYQAAYLLLVCLPLIILLSWLMQWTYDFLLSLLRNKKEKQSVI